MEYLSYLSSQDSKMKENIAIKKHKDYISTKSPLINDKEIAFYSKVSQRLIKSNEILNN